MSIYADNHKAIDAILKCIDPQNIFGTDLQPALEQLQREGADGADHLASLLRDLLESRSEGILYALQVAASLEPTPALGQVLSQIARATPLKSGSQGRFPPEIAGAGRVGWTDGTHAKVSALAQKAVQKAEERSRELDAGLFRAAQQGNLAEASALVDRGANMKWTNEVGATPLFTASFQGSTDVVAFLVERGADVNQCNNTGDSPLMAACSQGHHATVTYLVGHRARIDHQNKYGYTALMRAAAAHCAEPVRGELVRFLVESGANVKLRNSEGETARDLQPSLFEGISTTKWWQIWK